MKPKTGMEFIKGIFNKELTRSLTDVDRMKVCFHNPFEHFKDQGSPPSSQGRNYSLGKHATHAPHIWTHQYHIKIKFVGSLNRIGVGNSQRCKYLPMEVCKIVKVQRYLKRLNERQITALVKFTGQQPRDRERDIMQTVYHNAYHQDPCALDFGINISNELAEIEASVTPAPRLKYHDNEREIECLPQVGQWNMMNKVAMSSALQQGMQEAVWLAVLWD